MNEQDNLQTNELNQGSKIIRVIIASVLITALTVGGSVYVWQKSVLKSTERSLSQQIATLQREISDLKVKIDEKANGNVPIVEEGTEDLQTEEELAKRTLINFFNYLEKDDFGNAVKLFHQDYWEQLNSFSVPSEQGNKAKVLENYCNAVGTCMKAEVLSVTAKKSGVQYSFVVQFIQGDGSIYVFGPCCGVTEEEMPSRKQFTFEVKKIDGIYKVITPPLYRP